SITSETRIAYGSRVSRQGRSRPCSANQSSSASCTAGRVGAGSVRPMAGFLDLHPRGVPPGDDGAATIEEGLALCRQLAAEGTTVVYATPHAHPPDAWYPVTEERVA